MFLPRPGLELEDLLLQSGDLLLQPGRDLRSLLVPLPPLAGLILDAPQFCWVGNQEIFLVMEGELRSPGELE